MNKFSGPMRTIKTFLYAQKIHWKSALYYRLQTMLWLMSSIFSVAVSIVFVSVIYNFSGGFPGWSYYQVLALVGIANIAGNTINYFINIYSLIDDMAKGGIDSILTKPVNPIIFILSRFGFVQGVSGIVGGLIVTIYAASHFKVPLSGLIFTIISLPLAIACIVLFVLSFGLAMYIFFKRASFVDWFFSNMMIATRYPLSIFGSIGILVFTIVLPLGLATYYPAELLLGKLGYASGAWLILMEIALTYSFYKFSMWVLREKYASGGG